MADTSLADYINGLNETYRIADERARLLFLTSLPSLFEQLNKDNVFIISSAVFPVYYKIYGQGFYVIQNSDNYVAGFVCVSANLELPSAERVMVLCMMLLKDEKKVLIIGNWDRNPLFSAWNKLRRRYPRNIFDKLF